MQNFKETDLFLKSNIKGLLLKYNAQPLKKFGQNFLIGEKIAQMTIKAANLKESDVVLEIGPGIGSLTKELAKKAKSIIAVEKDEKMAEIAKETLKDFNNVKIIREDALRINLQFPKPYKVVGNLPFYLTAPLIRNFLEAKNRPEEMILMVQKEMGQRICASPPRMNLLAVSVQIYAKAEIIGYASKKYFWPQPKVDSAIIKIIPDKTNDNFEEKNKELFFKIVKAGFSQPRKQLINNLSNSLKVEKNKIKSWLFKNNISPCQRAETLNIEDWTKLAKSFKIS